MQPVPPNYPPPPLLISGCGSPGLNPASLELPPLLLPAQAGPNLGLELLWIATEPELPPRKWQGGTRGGKAGGRGDRHWGGGGRTGGRHRHRQGEGKQGVEEASGQGGRDWE